MTESDILKRTTECGDCLLWTGSFVHGTRPVVSIKNKKLYVKRHLLELAGSDLRRNCVISTCGNNTCVNPEHLLVVSRTTVLKRTAASGAFSTIAVRARVAAGKRKKSKLSQEAALEIRNSSESIAVLAAKHGITEAYGYMIRRGRFRQDYSNPFMGLMT